VRASTASALRLPGPELMRTVFVGYLVVIVAGLVYFTAVGLLHR
jgi:hypothetical protein